jgi:hypothetical protein
MRGDISIQDIADNVKKAVQDVRKQRGDEYRLRLNTLPPTNLSIFPVQQELVNQLNDFGVKLTRKQVTVGKGPMAVVKSVIVPDFSTSTLGDVAAQNQVRKVVSDVLTWPQRNGVPPDLIPHEMMDTLKRRLDAYYGQTSDARKLTAAVKNSVRTELGQVPGYNAMTSAYEKATRFLDEVEPELSAKRTTMKGTTVRKLTYALNQNNDYRQLLVDALDAKTGSALHDQIAGHALSKWAPRGLMRTVVGGKILFGMGAAFHPAALLEASLTSPRAMGELVSGVGQLKKFAGPAAGKVGRTLAAPGVYRPVLNAQPSPQPSQEYDYINGRLVPRL